MGTSSPTVWTPLSVTFLQAGVPVNVISERLGQSSPAFTVPA